MLELFLTNSTAYPQSIMQVLDDALINIDIRSQNGLTIAERVVQLMGCVANGSALNGLDALYTQSMEDEIAHLRKIIAQSLDACPLHPLQTLTRQEPEKALAVLERWMLEEANSEVLSLELTIFSNYSSNLTKNLLEKLRRELPGYAIDIGTKKIEINGLDNAPAIVHEAMAWLAELTNVIERRDTLSMELYESNKDIIHFIFKKIQQYPTARMNYESQMRQMAEKTESLAQDIQKDIETNELTEKSLDLTRQKELLQLIHDYLVKLGYGK